MVNVYQPFSFHTVNEQTLIPHLFRTESSKIVSVLCKTFGLANIQIAEDIMADTFLLATETWASKGVPESPSAWLYKVASNRTKDYLRRDLLFYQKIKPELQHTSPEPESIETFEINVSEDSINDSQLQMLFALCHPGITRNAQIALSLRILCGFGIEEIARAFLSNKSVINKRLFRAKQKLRESNIPVALPPEDELLPRLDNVLTILYLLFNEGYYSSTEDIPLRKDFCVEAISLTHLLCQHPQTNTPKANALLALMCFHASRFDARVDQHGHMILYDDQDVSLWDAALIKQGLFHLSASATGEETSKYHLEAAIAYWHTQHQTPEQKWDNILFLYNRLLQIEYSPIAALNRAYAFAQVHGNEKAIIEAEKTGLGEHYLYHLLLADLHTDVAKKRQHLRSALALIPSNNEKMFIQQKIDALD